jgi:signal transduction histidine kinase
MEDLIDCHWSDTHYLIFSNNVYDPLIYYSHIFPLIATIALAIFIFFSNRFLFPSKFLILLAATFSLWILFDLVVWATEIPEYTITFWSLLMLCELFLYVFALLFLYTYFYNDIPSQRIGVVALVAYLPIVFLIATKFDLSYYDGTNCDRTAIESYLWYYVYFLEVCISILIMYFGIKKLRSFSKTDSKKKNEHITILLGVLFFLLFFSGGNILGSYLNDWTIGQYGIFGMPAFVFVIAYTIVRYKFLQVKLVGAQALTVALVVIILSQFTYAESTLSYVLNTLTLIMVSGAGYYLIKSVGREVKQRESLETITQNLAQANERLKELDAAKSEFISIASHQLRTPLTAIKGYVSLLLEGSYGAINKEVLDVLNKVYSVNDRLAHLVEDLLNVSRIEAGRIQYNFQYTKIEDILRELYDMFVMSAKEKGLDFQLDVQPGMLPEIVADPNKIKEITSNLIDNAIKYTPVGFVRISLAVVDQNMRITIADSGIGIKPENKDNLFNKFVRSQETSRMVVGGAGLGLYVGKSFVEAHKGRIWADSAGPGQGSQFIIELPIHNPSLAIGTTEKAKEA